jgi:ElaB/YqjD/DUF883 family membrane-anchored ribosome-binding protein
MSSFLRFVVGSCVLALVVVPVSAQTQTAPVSSDGPAAASSVMSKSQPAISINAAVSREARRAAAATAQQASQQKRSWASRHKWATVAIVAAVAYVGIGLLVWSVSEGG